MSVQATQTQQQSDTCELISANARLPIARSGHGTGVLLAALGALATFPAAALALPFDPVPSSFQRWLNAKRDWPDNEQRRFETLAECSDQTAATSPYRMPVFTCLQGKVTIQRPGTAAQTCTIHRVSYFPTNQRVRLWTGSCR